MSLLEVVGMVAFMLCLWLVGKPPPVGAATKITEHCRAVSDRKSIRCVLPRRDTLFINVSFKSADKGDGETSFVRYHEMTRNMHFCGSAYMWYRSTRGHDKLYFHMAPHESPPLSCKYKVVLYVSECELWYMAPNTSLPVNCGDIFKVGVDECSRQYRICWKTGHPAILPSGPVNGRLVLGNGRRGRGGRRTAAATDFRPPRFRQRI